MKVKNYFDIICAVAPFWRKRFFWKNNDNPIVNEETIENLVETFWARSLVVSDLRSETKGSRFESGCQLCAEVSSLQ